MKPIILLIFAMVFSLQCHGQERISLSFDGAPLRSFIDTIERQSSYRFFYLDEWVDTINVSINRDHTVIQDALGEGLSGTGINFFINGQSIILTPGVQLAKQVDSSLYSSASAANESAAIRFRRELPDKETRNTENIILQVGKKTGLSRDRYTMSGYVRENRSGEPLTGVVVYAKGTNNGVTTDQFGAYSLVLRAGLNLIGVEFMGMRSVSQRINIVGDGKLDFVMEESVTQLKEVIVESEGEVNVSNVQMGIARIDVRSMKNIPKILGENDVLKVATTLPGVKSVGEGASGLNVRGGHADQNLVMLNEATIFNTSHFLGFFSVFNPDAIRSFELYKSGIPVQFGGRLSSTFELLMRDGNQKKFSGQGGIGPITSHLTLEVPVVKDKTSIMVGGRTTYSNWVLRAFPESGISNTSARFYDFFGRITHSPNDKNTLYVSLYSSFDKFSLSSDTLFSYSNKLASLQWRHVFNSNLDAILSATHSRYDYSINYSSNPLQAFDMGFSVRESNLKWEFNQTRGKHRITYGLQSKLYEVAPGFVEKGADASTVRVREVEPEQGIESALFLADNFDVTPSLSVYGGIRYSAFTFLGPKTLFVYDNARPKAESSIADTLTYAGNKPVKNFNGPEYRFSIRYKINGESSVKASYNRTRQYIHMLSNTVSVSPTDTWKLSDPHVKPQVADQVSVGYYRDIKDDVFEVSTELYYKWLRNMLDYKTGAALLVNEHIEQEILQGDGKAYGVEVLLRKRSGKLTGWIGYAYSRTLLRLNGSFPSERVNHGNYFPANYDKPHDVNVVTNFKITRRYSLSLNFNYSTGRPITYPVATYRFGNTFRVNYSDRNAYRIPDYIRADLGFNIEGNHRIKKLAHSYWSISIYNILGRRNPYSIYFRVQEDEIKAYKLSIFGAPIPTITYHFKF
jgi:hypothetical protein